jgi:exodeoxyribonuclease VII small subunit
LLKTHHKPSAFVVAFGPDFKPKPAPAVMPEPFLYTLDPLIGVLTLAKKIAPSAPADFEQALGELEALVERMEQGELSLEASLAEFERGIALARQCQQSLQAAEQKVRLLTGEGEEEPLDTPDAEDGDGE